MSANEKIRKVKNGANAVQHGAKGAEDILRAGVEDKPLRKIRRLANGVKHIATALEKVIS